ncbi:hypothetical protein EDM80_02705 [bacterium]|nr:MAG: hypothetical protein EDM80_02705 [bacterium]RIK62584.1 MAG: hypothetical protein DCC64_09840 [Planctomycetota bacterium]
MPRHFAFLALGIALLAQTAAAQEASDAFNLFRVSGRAWTTRSVHWERGKPATVTLERVEVTDVRDDGCRLKRQRLNSYGLPEGEPATEDVVFNAALKQTFEHPADARRLNLSAAGLSWKASKLTKRGDASNLEESRSLRYPALLLHRSEVRQNGATIVELVEFRLAEPDPFALYRLAGRKWVHRITGADGQVTFEAGEVTETGEARARVRLYASDAQGQILAGAKESEQVIEFETAKPWQAPAAGAGVEIKDASFNAGGIQWAALRVTAAGKVSHYARNWPGLELDVEVGGTRRTLECFYTGHGTGQFYATKGNFVLARAATLMEQMPPIVNYMRQEVVAVGEREGTLRMTTYDSAMNKLVSSDSKLPRSGLKDSPHRGEEPVEELVFIRGSGGFYCLRQKFSADASTTTIWLHCGATLKMRTVSQNFSLAHDAVELRLR